eukprot:c16783_g1_i4.p1 GENE.c16783_g1_i4~~c16783_g1_i4.p1  ORF type:complete len:133 (+),score=40.20 c16783_g1_i4:150-548(+)
MFNDTTPLSPIGIDFIKSPKNPGLFNTPHFNGMVQVVALSPMSQMSIGSFASSINTMDLSLGQSSLPDRVKMSRSQNVGSGMMSLGTPELRNHRHFTHNNRTDEDEDEELDDDMMDVNTFDDQFEVLGKPEL